MNSNPETALLTWPGIGLPGVLTDSGWAHVERPVGLDFGFDPPIGKLPQADLRAFVLAGERLAALRALDGVIVGRLSLVYLDVPRLSHVTFAREQLRVSTWLSALRSHVEAAARLLRPAGRLVIHVDDEGAALAATALDDLLDRSSRETTILWQKKYGPQNDLRGRVDDAQDYLLVYSIGEGPPASNIDSAWWPWQYAGKSEDGTREAEQLRVSGIISLPVIPKTSKPAKLVERLLDAFTEPGDLVLECFSDTGFASAVAVTMQRLPILLGGGTDIELDRLARCSLPRLENAAGGQRFVGQYVLQPPAYVPAAVAASGESIELHAFDVAVPRARELRPILIEKTGADVPPSARGGFPPLAVAGQVSEAIVALEPAVGCGVTLALFDWTGQAPPLGEVRLRLAAASRLLEKEGVVAVAIGHMHYAAVRLIGEMHVFGRAHYLGTIAIQPANGKSPKLVALFKGLPQARLGKIGLPAQRDYTAPDGDPRGTWRDPGHKGARGGGKNTAFEYRLPPYRWQLVGGELPLGVWQVNPVSGVVWAPRLESAGVFRFTVRVTDSGGMHSEAECAIEVIEEGRPNYPDAVWWMDRPPTVSDSAPRVTSLQLPRGVVGEPYVAVLEAKGGMPINETKAPGEPTEDGKRTRYWEFSRQNLVGSILEDRTLFGATGKASPRIKVYVDRETATTTVELSWWDEKRLSGQSAVMRLVSMLSQPGDLVMIEGGGSPDDVLRSGRRCILLGEASRFDDRFPFVGRVGEPIAVWDPDRRAFRPNYDSPDFDTGLPWTLGFLPPETLLGEALYDEMRSLHGVTADSSEAMTMLGRAEWPTRSRCSELAQQYGDHFSRVHVLYYRGKPPRGMSPLTFRRIPFDFAGAR